MGFITTTEFNKEFTKFMKALSDFSNCIYVARGTSMGELKDNGVLIKNATKKSTQSTTKWSIVD